jgi:hypothetical protein
VLLQAAAQVRLLEVHAGRLDGPRNRGVLDHLDIRSRDEEPMSNGMKYFWTQVAAIFIEKKVDRYRRGHH